MLANIIVRKDVVMGEKNEEYCRNCILAFLVILFFIAPLTVWASEQTFSKTAGEKLRTPVTLTCVNSPIEKVLMELADQANINIIKGPDVIGNVTAKVINIPLEEALTNILAAYNCTYITTENMVRVIPLPETAPLKEQQVTRIYKITYADANQVYTSLDEFKSGKGEIAINRGTSHIMVTDTEDKIKAMDKFVEQIDHITSQVLVEVRIYDVTTKEGFELDPQWHIGRNAPYTADTIITPADEVKTLEISPSTQYDSEFRKEVQWGWPANYPNEQYSGVIEGYGIAERQYETYSQESGRTETETTYDNPQPIMSNWRRKPFVGGSFDRVTGGSLSFSILNDAVDLNFLLSILHSQIEARLLANPRILVLDNETAKFEIVREFPYRELLQVTREDPMSYTDFKKVGVDLEVTPHIARDGVLRLQIEPKFSVLVSKEALAVLKGTDDLGNMSYVRVLGVPVIDSRRLETTTMIKDGQTVTIGGLRKREITKGVSKVPVLADLPIVGGLFTSESESSNINELIVFITAKIITEPTLSESEKKLLDETVFTTPKTEKTRIEKGEFEKTEPEKTEPEKAQDEKADITETLDMLLKKLEQPEEE